MELKLENKYFYAYSYRLSLFIRSLGVKYVDIGINKKTKQKYYKFEKSQKLDEIIALYNKVKNRFLVK